MVGLILFVVCYWFWVGCLNVVFGVGCCFGIIGWMFIVFDVVVLNLV